VTVAAVVACLAAAALAALRWLRVAQREHYLGGPTARFAARWWLGLGYNRLLAAGVAVNVVLSLVSPFFAFLVAAPVAVGPLGLRLTGRAPGPLAWTRRLRTLAAVWTGLHVLVVFVGASLGLAAPAAALAAALVPALVAAACALTAPLERRLGQRHVQRAAARLRSVRPTVLALTGSYGKTTTKGYVAHLVAGAHSVLATPRSFNNSAGLARTVNEHLAPGTEVFVAEMGTYGPGEIATMCEWVRPEVAAITAIGPVHLERMKNEATIVAAKAEIAESAHTVVLNVDSEWLAPLADRLAADGKKVLRCSTLDPAADVYACREGDTVVVTVAGREIARAARPDVLAGNVACAVALALAAGTPTDVIARRLPTLPAAANRLSVTTGASGATVIDDTYNANPAGCRAALAALRRHAGNARRVVVVTPGMVELGPRQHEENAAFAAAASELATDLVIVGATNRAALVEGARGGARVVLVDDRDQAVAWVKENVGPGDVVLYENDLPDHFP
jgi:UDP-N-acetylmuramoyl-tripeptide--D-alanyl-D-alanine ligase